MTESNILNTEEKIRLIERMAGELNSLTLTAAMENARLGSESKIISENIEMLKYITEQHLTGSLDQYRNSPEEKIWASTGDPNGKCKEIKGVIKDVILDLVELWCGSIEKAAFQTLKDCMQIKAKPLSLCLEEIRKTALKIRLTANPDSLKHRRSWHNREVELSIKPLTNQRAEFLSFDIGGLEFAEEFGYVKEILGYHDYIEVITPQKDLDKIKITDWLSVDYYIDLYQLLKLPLPVNQNDMQIIVLNFQTYEYETRPYTVSNLISVAFPVDFINYPFATRPGKSVISEVPEKLKEVLLDSWNWIEKACQNVTDVESVIRKQLHFIDWPKILNIK